MPKKIFIAVVILLIVAGASYYFFIHQAPAKADVRKFTGILTAINGEEIRLKGAFYPLPDAVPENLRSAREFSFRTDSSTRFWGILTTPPWEKILARGGAYRLKPDELPRKEGPGSLEELKGLIGTGNIFVEASFNSSILGGRNHIASTVVYRYLPNPPLE